MKKVEIITLRSTWQSRQFEAIDILRQIQSGHCSQQPSAIHFYSHAELESDISFHLHWKLVIGERAKSNFGIQLANALREYGLVYHGIWQKVPV